MSRCLMLYKDGPIHHRGEKTQLEDQHVVRSEGRSLPDGCCPLQHLKSCRTCSGLCRSTPSDVASVSASSRPAVLFATIEQTDMSRGRGGRCEIHLHAAWSQGKSLRFNVGRWWVDISLTESGNSFLLRVKECEELVRSIPPLRSVIILCKSVFAPFSKGVS